MELFCTLMMGVTTQIHACVKIHRGNKRPRIAKTIWKREVGGHALPDIKIHSIVINIGLLVQEKINHWNRIEHLQPRNIIIEYMEMGYITKVQL